MYLFTFLKFKQLQGVIEIKVPSSLDTKPSNPINASRIGISFLLWVFPVFYVPPFLGL